MVKCMQHKVYRMWLIIFMLTANHHNQNSSSSQTKTLSLLSINPCYLPAASADYWYTLSPYRLLSITLINNHTVSVLLCLPHFHQYIVFKLIMMLHVPEFYLSVCFSVFILSFQDWHFYKGLLLNGTGRDKNKDSVLNPSPPSLKMILYIKAPVQEQIPMH